MRAVLVVLTSASLLSGCISVHQMPLPDNRAVAQTYARAADGDGAALRQEAAAFRSGSGGVERNDDEALRLLLLAAEGGDAQAQLELGRYYQGYPGRDPDQAAYWFGRQAQAGNPAAAEALARLYADPRQGASDGVAALGWAHVANNRYLIERYTKDLGAVQLEQARRQADAWLKRYPLANRKSTP